MKFDNPYLKKLNCSVTAFCVQEPVEFGHKKLRKNGVLIWHKKRLVYCEKFPRGYKGKNPTLEVWEYDFLSNTWEDYPEKSDYSRMLWELHVAGGQKKVKYDMSAEDYAQLMKHDRRHKHSGGGQFDYVNAITDYDCVGCPQMRAGHVEGYTAYMPYGSKEWQYQHA